MALIQCPECGKEISDKAKNCPNCGVPIIGEADIKLKTNHGHRKILVFAVLMFILIVGAVGGLFVYNSKRVDLVAKSVVKVHCYDEDGKEIATGSGFIAYDSETIITNYHVLAAGIIMSIETESGASFNVVNLRGYSEDDDIAILGLDGDTGLKPLKFDDSRPKKGDKIYAIGSPQGIKNTISDGLVSSIYEDENGNLDVIQISAPISQGSSGGVLLNSACKVIGVTSAGYTDYAYQNINFAIPVRKVEKIYSEGVAISLETLIAEIHKNDHECAFSHMSEDDIWDLVTTFNNAELLDGQTIYLKGYYSSEKDSAIYLYQASGDVTNDANKDFSRKNDEKYNEVYKMICLPLYYGDVVFHDDSQMEAGDELLVCCVVRRENAYNDSRNIGNITFEEAVESIKYPDYYTFRVEPIEIVDISKR